MNFRLNATSFASGFMLAVLLIAGGLLATHPASAAAAISAAQSAFSCATTAACVSGANTRSGPGVAGTSTSGFGISGTSTSGKGINGSSTSNVAIEGSSSASYGVEAVSSKSYGLWATTATGPAAIMGTSSGYGGFGVYGYTAASPYGYALFGNAPNGGFGVYGLSGGNGDAVVGDAMGAGTGTTGISSAGLGAEGFSSSGSGVQGVSNSSYGVVGSTTSGLAGVMGETSGVSEYGVYGFNSADDGGFGVYGAAKGYGVGVSGMTVYGEGDGVFGYASDAGTGVYGSSVTGDGLAGVSGTGYGVIGRSESSTGVYANSATGDAIDATATSGFGLNASSQNVSGVYASSAKAAAVYATSGTGDGVYATSDLSNAVEANVTAGRGNGVIAYSTYGAGVVGVAFNSFPSIEGFSVTGGYSLAGYDYYSGRNTFYVDDAGNIGYTGSLNNYARLTSGAMVKTFSPKTATPTVEDTGTAQLVDGAAVVRLDPVFAASIDPQATYRVFITPGGDTNGLYVPQKTAAGFLVRESKGGRSTVSFDYRIVATAIGQVGQRMSVAASAALPSSVHVSAAARVAHTASPLRAPLHPKIPRAPRVPALRTPQLPQFNPPRPPSQAALAPAGLR